MRTRKITGRILTGLALLISTLGTVTVANEIFEYKCKKCKI